MVATSAPPEISSPHRIAAALIRFQTSDRRLPKSIEAPALNLIHHAPEPPLPRNFEHLCEFIDQAEGVRFRNLFDQLPKEHAATGDEALQLVLALAIDAIKEAS